RAASVPPTFSRWNSTTPSASVSSRTSTGFTCFQSKADTSERSKNDGLRIRRHCGPPRTCRRYLGDHQCPPKLRFERKEAGLDPRGAAAAVAGLDPLVLAR